MRVFVAGATGAIGMPLVAELISRGHRVTGTTRSETGAAALRAMGAEPVVLDAFDEAAVRGAVKAAKPEVVVHQLTSLPKDATPRALKKSLAATARLRRETVPLFADAARAAGARRFIAQSISFVTAPDGDGGPNLDERAPLWLDAPAEFRETVESVRDLEAATTETPGIEGVVLRYGFFYGPGTWYAQGGTIARMVKRRMYPLVGDGWGMASFIHVDDAVDATILALANGTPGIYNVTDNEPVTQNEWLPELARMLGASSPLRIPEWLGHLVAGPIFVHYATTLCGALSKKAIRELSWQPRSWNDGFREIFAAA